MARRLLAAGLTLAMGYTSGPLMLGGCAGASWPANGKLPERVVDKLADCGKKGPTPLKSVSYDLAFTVHVTEDDQEARVDDVMLTASTLHLHEVEACMKDALYGMRTPLEALALRRRSLAPDTAIAPETRALLGQAQVAILLEAVAFIVVGYAAYTVVVHLIVDKRRTKPRPRPVAAEPDDPPAPMPVPVLSAATVKPTATAAPTATTMPTAATVNIDCKKVKQDCIETCSETSLPTPDFGVKFRRCMRACMAAKGCVY